MASVSQLKNNNASQIGNKTNPNSISPHNVSDQLDNICDELLLRGAVQVPDTATLATVSKANSRAAIIPGVGLFTALQTDDDPNNTTTFPAFDAGWLWQLITSADSSLEDRFTITGDTTRNIPDGQKTREIYLKPTNGCTIRIGTTDGGDEVMEDKEFSPLTWDGTIKGVFADGADTPIYIKFSVDPGSTKVIIFKSKL